MVSSGLIKWSVQTHSQRRDKRHWIPTNLIPLKIYFLGFSLHVVLASISSFLINYLIQRINLVLVFFVLSYCNLFVSVISDNDAKRLPLQLVCFCDLDAKRWFVLHELFIWEKYLIFILEGRITAIPVAIFVNLDLAYLKFYIIQLFSIAFTWQGM